MSVIHTLLLKGVSHTFCHFVPAFLLCSFLVATTPITSILLQLASALTQGHKWRADMADSTTTIKTGVYFFLRIADIQIWGIQHCFISYKWVILLSPFYENRVKLKNTFSHNFSAFEQSGGLPHLNQTNIAGDCVQREGSVGLCQESLHKIY